MTMKPMTGSFTVTSTGLQMHHEDDSSLSSDDERIERAAQAAVRARDTELAFDEVEKELARDPSTSPSVDSFIDHVAHYVQDQSKRVNREMLFAAMRMLEDNQRRLKGAEIKYCQVRHQVDGMRFTLDAARTSLQKEVAARATAENQVAVAQAEIQALKDQVRFLNDLHRPEPSYFCGGPDDCSIREWDPSLEDLSALFTG